MVTIIMWSLRKYLYPNQKDNNVLRYYLQCRYITSDNHSPRISSKFPMFVTTNTSTWRETMVTKLRNVMTVYEDFIGLKDVQAAHTRVMQAEEKFINSQEFRRNAHKDLVGIQDKLRELRSELDRIPRGNEKYLELVTKEINVMREEKQFREQFEDHEKSERTAFNELSSALRFSHEKEKAQNEKTKYWSVMGSLLGAFVGILGTSINSRMKIHQMRKVMEESSTESMAQVQDKLNILFNQIDEASKLHLTPASGVAVDSSNDSTIIESRISTAMNLLTKQIDEFNEILQKLRVTPPSPTEAITSSENNSSDAVLLQPQPVISYDDTQLRRNIQYGTITILICVPIITKLLGSIFGD